MPRSSAVDPHAPTRGAVRTGLLLMTVLALLLGTGVLGAVPTTARADGGRFGYDQDGLNWAIVWDDTVWS